MDETSLRPRPGETAEQTVERVVAAVRERQEDGAANTVKGETMPEGLSAMASMSKAIRLELEKYGTTLRDVPDDALAELATIVAAFSADLRDELRRREGIV